MKIIDLHCDTMMWHLQGCEDPLHDNRRHINCQKLKAGGAYAQCFALFVPVAGGDTFEEKVEDCYLRYNKLYQYYKKDLLENKNWLESADTIEKIKENEKDGSISSILTLEDGTFLGNKLERIDEAYLKGARMLSLTWNTENEIGYPNSWDKQKHMRGLKKFGFEVVERMNEIGMIIDVSHLNEGGFWDVIKHTEKPIIASHSCSRKLCEHPRNLTDEQLKAIGENGGVVGMNYLTAFVNTNAKETRIEDIVKHIKHIINIAGTESAALGSDFDGMGDAMLEFKDYGGYPQIVKALMEEYPESIVEKICYKNALRVFAECWK